MLQKVVEYLAPIPARRKAVLLFSQGIAFDLEAFAADSNSRSFDTMRRLLAAAREGNVAVYTVDPRGLQGSTDPSIGEKPVPVTRDAGVDTLRDLATATGGRAVVSTNEIVGRSTASRARTGSTTCWATNRPTAASKTRARRIEVKTRAPGTSLPASPRLLAIGSHVGGGGRQRERRSHRRCRCRTWPFRWRRWCSPIRQVAHPWPCRSKLAATCPATTR